MAKSVVVACLDNAVGAFGRPAFFASEGLARRSFSEEVNRVAEDNVISKHPRDFSLYQLAVFDDITGEFTNVQSKLVDAVSVVTSNVESGG